MRKVAIFVALTAAALLANGTACADEALPAARQCGTELSVLSHLEGTVWRYQESKTEFTTIKFTSGAGGYFRFNRFERKFIFTYTYGDGVGIIYRDKDEFRSNKDASRLHEAHFLVERDTLVYDGREFVRMRGLEKETEYYAATGTENEGGVRPAASAGSADEHYNGTHNSGVRPARYDYGSEGAGGNVPAKAETRKADAPSSGGKVSYTKRADDPAAQSPTRNAATVSSQTVASPSSLSDSADRGPVCWAVGTDVSGFEGRSVSGSMPKAAYDGRDQGKNVVRIWVDRDGKVVRAEVNQTGTTLTSGYFANKATLVASRLRLTPKPKAPRTETGFLTVVFFK